MNKTSLKIAILILMMISLLGLAISYNDAINKHIFSSLGIILGVLILKQLSTSNNTSDEKN